MSFKDSILQGDFEQALRQIDMNSFEEVYQEILESAHELEDIRFYQFLKYIIDTHENSSRMNYFASQLMVTAFNYLPRGYAVAFEHAKTALGLAPEDTSLKEYMLLFYEIPERLLDRETAMQYANEILRVDASNAAANLVVCSCPE